MQTVCPEPESDARPVRYQTIGHSVNAPWLNLKKLVLLASTTAMMTVFFPDFSATNGFIFRAGAVLAGVDGVLKNHRSSFCQKVCSGGAGDGTGVVGVGTCAPEGGRFCRGVGRGLSGRTSKRSVSSWRVGIGVVRPLEGIDEIIDMK